MILRKSRRFDATLRRAGLATAALALGMTAEAGAQPAPSPRATTAPAAQAAPPAQAQRPAAAGTARPAQPAAATPARPAQPAGTAARPGTPAQPATAPRPATAAPAAGTRPASGPAAPAQGTRPAASGAAAPAQAPRPAAPAAARPAAPAGAPGGAGASLVAEFGAWAVYAAQSGRSKICYALAQPADRLPKNLNRDPAYLFVSFRPAENVRNEIALVMGFATKEDAPAEAAIGTATFALLPKGTSAWLRNPAEEGQAIAAMRRGQSLTVKVQSVRGNALTDRYPLTGFGPALERAQAECG